MGDLPNRIDLTVEDISSAHGTTKPRLDIEVSALPSSNQTIRVQQLSPELTFRFPKPDKHLKGPIPKVPIAQISEITRQGTAFTGSVELTRQELDRIESLRDGGDIEIELDIWMVGDRNDNRESGRFEISKQLIDAQWVRILDVFDYHGKRDVLLDLSIDNPRIRDQLSTAYAKIDSAQTKHDTGDYPAAVVACRRAIEALRSLEEVEHALDERKHEELDNIMGTFETGFAGGLAHAEEKTNISPAMRRDSEFALNITKACARYISTAIEEKSG